jgi:hypothetical protein
MGIFNSKPANNVSGNMNAAVPSNNVSSVSNASAPSGNTNPSTNAAPSATGGRRGRKTRRNKHKGKKH